MKRLAMAVALLTLTGTLDLHTPLKAQKSASPSRKGANGSGINFEGAANVMNRAARPVALLRNDEAQRTDVLAQSDGLPRHRIIGLTVGPTDIKAPENRRMNPPTVKSVAAGGAAEAAGIQPGDVVSEVDTLPVDTSADFVRLIGRHLAGDQVRVGLVRAGEKISKTATLKPHPFEITPDASVLYRSVQVEGARRRVIVTRPNAPGRYPAVLLIGGLGCYSLDGELMRDIGYGPILRALLKHGFVTMRVEKTGEGDSEGPACTDGHATAELEAEGYVAALRALKGYNFVESDKVFIFAHSLGPLIAALVLPQESVRGVVAAETIGRRWFEYGLENVRRQSSLAGEPPDQVDAEVRAHEKCAHHFYVLHEPAEAVVKLGEQCGEMIRSYAGVPSTYMQQIGDFSLAKQWKQIDVPVLVIYGTSDPATSADEGRYLVEIINTFHPGRASFVELPGMGHDFARYSSQAEYLRRRHDGRPHPFDDEALVVLTKWMDEQSDT